MNTNSLQVMWPLTNAILNGFAFTFLCLGFYAIKKKSQDLELHKFFMLSAFAISAIFLVSYLGYHYTFPSKKFSGEGLIRPIYFFILISHILLSSIIVPFICTTIYYALKKVIDKHRKWAKWTYPLWSYVNFTGVLIYILNFILYP